MAASLAALGYDVRAMTRRPDKYRGPGQTVAGDVTDPGSLTAALAGGGAAYYLVHSLGADNFAAKDLRGARNFADAFRCGCGADRLPRRVGGGRRAAVAAPALAA